MKNIFVKTLGCKVNTFDSHALENQFRKNGYQVVEHVSAADVAVINTCSVTAVAEKEARYLLRRYKRENPASFRVVTGCYAQIDSGSIAQMPEVDFIVPNEVKERLVNLVEERWQARSDGIDPGSKLPDGIASVRDNKQKHFKSALTLFDNPRSNRARAFLKIQDGCNGFCSYCQIPYARGESRSVPVQQVLQQAKRLSQEGVAELVLTGIHIGDYGEDFGSEGREQKIFLQLLEDLFHLEGLKRVRISSLEPAELTLGLIQVLAKNRDKFCDHFHLPLQSGSDKILKKMNRKYTCARYLESVRMIRDFFPQAQISADVIPGFPGEGEQDFQETIDFIKQCQLASLHVFPYSKRPNTAAMRFPDHLDARIIKERAEALRSLSKIQQRHFCQKNFLQKTEVLWEVFDREKLRWFGKTKNYLPIVSSSNYQTEIGNIEPISVKGYFDDTYLLGAKLSESLSDDHS